MISFYREDSLQSGPGAQASSPAPVRLTPHGLSPTLWVLSPKAKRTHMHTL